MNVQSELYKLKFKVRAMERILVKNKLISLDELPKMEEEAREDFAAERKTWEADVWAGLQVGKLIGFSSFYAPGSFPTVQGTIISKSTEPWEFLCFQVVNVGDKKIRGYKIGEIVTVNHINLNQIALKEHNSWTTFG